MKKIVLILVGLVLTLLLCCCTDNGKAENVTTDNGKTVTTDNGKTVTTEQTGNDTTAEPETESPDPENDPHWTDNY